MSENKKLDGRPAYALEKEIPFLVSRPFLR